VIFFALIRLSLKRAFRFTYHDGTLFVALVFELTRLFSFSLFFARSARSTQTRAPKRSRSRYTQHGRTVGSFGNDDNICGDIVVR
jgi:hypothetical protein